MTKIVTTSKIFLVNDKRQLLLLKIGIHTQQPERSHTMDFPGGLVDDGESARQGALRELREETGIELQPGDLTLAYAMTGYYEPKQESYTHLRYIVKLDYTPDVTVSWEHKSYEWSDFDTVLDKYELRPHFTVALKYIQEHKLLDTL